VPKQELCRYLLTVELAGENDLALDNKLKFQTWNLSTYRKFENHCVRNMFWVVSVDKKQGK
jgi:hypothetical protein